MSSTSAASSDTHQFVPPGPSDLRSPCPALNALANYGHINHDGRNLSAHALADAMQRVYNISKPLAYLLAYTGIFTCGDGRTVDLHQLAKHNVIEHDASLSRQDTVPPDEYAPVAADSGLVDQLMNFSKEDFLVLNDLAMARVIRESQTRSGSLDFIHAELGKSESSLILQVFGGEKGEVDKQVLRTWLMESRLPANWERPKTESKVFGTFLLSRRVGSAMDRIRKSDQAQSSTLGPLRVLLGFVCGGFWFVMSKVMS